MSAAQWKTRAKALGYRDDYMLLYKLTKWGWACERIACLVDTTPSKVLRRLTQLNVEEDLLSITQKELKRQATLLTHLDNMTVVR